MGVEIYNMPEKIPEPNSLDSLEGIPERPVFDESFRTSEHKVLEAYHDEIARFEQHQIDEGEYDEESKEYVAEARYILSLLERYNAQDAEAITEVGEKLFRSTPERPFPGARTVAGDMLDVLAVARREKPIAMILKHESNNAALRHAAYAGLRSINLPEKPWSPGNSVIIIYDPEKENDALRLEQIMLARDETREYENLHKKEIGALLGYSSTVLKKHEIKAHE